MRRFIFTIVLCVGCIIAADAQSTFTERLQKSNTSEGKVSVTHDKSIDALVNGTTATKPTEKAKPEQKQAPKDKAECKDKTEVKNKVEAKDKVESKDKVTPKENEVQASVATPDTVEVHKKVMKGMKINGYRVQVFAGGNSRNDRLKAERAGESMKSLFPGVPVYVHFYTPRWVCRIGNYRTYEEAHEILKRVKDQGYDSAIIVKGKITVQY